MNKPLDKRSFIYYCCISVKEDLNTDFKTSELILSKDDKEVYQSCKYCHQVIQIKKGFKENAFICNINFYKMRIKLIHKYTLYGQKIKNIGFLQT